MVISRSALTE